MGIVGLYLFSLSFFLLSLLMKSGKKCMYVDKMVNLTILEAKLTTVTFTVNIMNTITLTFM